MHVHGTNAHEERSCRLAEGSADLTDFDYADVSEVVDSRTVRSWESSDMMGSGSGDIHDVAGFGGYGFDSLSCLLMVHRHCCDLCASQTVQVAQCYTAAEVDDTSKLPKARTSYCPLIAADCFVDPMNKRSDS